MTEMKKTLRVNKKDITMDPEVMFLRLLAVNCKKKVPLKRVLSYENASVPPSIFTEQGVMVSCVKSDFMHKLEELVPGEKIVKITACDAVIFDGHAVIQQLTPPTSSTTNVTFQEMAARFVAHVLKPLEGMPATGKTDIHVTFDRYVDLSAKQQTRGERGDGQAGIVYHIQPEVSIPKNWKQFLKTGQNKTNLAEYYTAYMTERAGASLTEQQTLYISGGQGETALRVTKDGCSESEPLKSNHEEADTRMCVHARVAAENGADHIVISSPDTDVLVLLLHHRPAISASEVFFFTGREGKHADLTRYIPVHQIHDSLETSQLNILLPVYCLTGCDTISSFWGHGKKAVYRLMMQKSDAFQDLSQLGTNLVLRKPEKVAATKFVCNLYGKTDCDSLNALRCEKTSRKSVPAKKLPPTDDSFYLHLQRCIYQLRIWREAVVPMMEVLNPTEFGYEKTTDGTALRPKMMSQPPAAPELLNDLVCNCPPGSCDTEGCKCLENGQPCTAACNCEAMCPEDESVDEVACENPFTQAMNFESDSDFDDDY